MSSDPLSFDDARPFTVLVRPPVNVLLAAESAADALYVSHALEALGTARYRQEFAPAARLADADLAKYSVVWLLNVADPGAAGWRAVADFVEQGGSAIVVLGDRVIHEAYLTPAARGVLPWRLQARARFDPPQFLDLQNLTHPLWKKFADWGTVGLTSEAVRECWTALPGPDERDAGVVAAFTDERSRAALVERAVGDGRVLLLTTSLDYRWNNLPVSEWFVVLIDQLLRYVAQGLSDHCNFTLGEPVRLPVPKGQAPGAFLLAKPGLQRLRQEAAPGARWLSVVDVDQVGNYRIVGAEAGSRLDLGFSVAADSAESSLLRLSKDDLDARLGTDRCTVARDVENLQRNVRAGRVGREAFPLAALLLLAAFLGEHFLANRFYDDHPPSDAADARGARPA